MSSAPLDLRAIAQTGLTALRAGDASTARARFEEIVSAGRADAAVWLALAEARGALADSDGKRAAIDAALALEPHNPRGMLMKADWLAESGDARSASAFYAAVLKLAPQNPPPEIQGELRRALAAVEKYQREFEDFIRAQLQSAGLTENTAAPRFSRAVDILLGKRRPYVQQPRYFYYPELPNAQFYERADFPFLDAIEAATNDIRAELNAIIAESNSFAPYVTQDPNRPQNTQGGMAGNADWSAYFLWKDGTEMPGAARCPKTVAALAKAPLTRIPNRAPSILFSQLKAGARIPPHTGMINTRLICHLPLIVPQGCDFRVGNDVRAWREGKAWVFDDTIEHEAWNRSAQNRFILIFDIWRPELSEEERQAFVTLCTAVDAYAPSAAWDA